MDTIPMKKPIVWVMALLAAVFLLFGCDSDPGRVEVEKFYTEKVMAVNEAANRLAAAKKIDEALAAMEIGFKVLQEAVAPEAALLQKYPATEKNPAIKKLQEDYLSASDKFSREVEALPNRFMADPKLSEALGRMKNRKR
jgi:hypothetical protein